MPQIEIDNTLPPPKSGEPVAYPWAFMNPGDSFYLRCNYREINKVRSRVVYAARLNGIKIQTRSEDEGLRVWLMEIKD